MNEQEAEMRKESYSTASLSSLSSLLSSSEETSKKWEEEEVEAVEERLGCGDASLFLHAEHMQELEEEIREKIDSQPHLLLDSSDSRNNITDNTDKRSVSTALHHCFYQEEMDRLWEEYNEAFCYHINDDNNIINECLYRDLPRCPNSTTLKVHSARFEPRIITTNPNSIMGHKECNYSHNIKAPNGGGGVFIKRRKNLQTLCKLMKQCFL